MLLTLALLLGAAQDVDLAADAIFLNTTGSLKFNSRPEDSTRLFLKEDLGKNGTDVVPALRPSLRFGDHRIEALYERWRLHWSHVNPAPIRFDGETIPAGSDLDSRIEIDRWGLRYDYRFRAEEVFELSAGVRADYWKTIVELSGPFLPGNIDHLYTLAIEPQLRARVAILRSVSFDASAAGILAKILRHRVRTFEGSATLGWSPTPLLQLSAGYRVNLMKFVNLDSQQRNEIDLLSRGPMLSLSLRF